jgi:hypothetical protein
MKVAFFSESPADQAALAVFTEGLLGAAPELIDRQLEGHGVTGVMSALDGVYRGIHYQSDADALVVVVDCDETELHSAAHDQPGASSPTCRFCKLRDIVTKARSQVQPRQGRPPLKMRNWFSGPCNRGMVSRRSKPPGGRGSLDCRMQFEYSTFHKTEAEA